MHTEVCWLGLYVPGWHGVHTALLVVVQLWPHELPALHRVQSRHCVFPTLDWYFPLAHSLHIVGPSVELYVPARHVPHTTLAALEQADCWYLPAAQTPHAEQAVAWLPPWYTLAPHVVHWYSPVLPAYLPGVQAVHVPSTEALHPLDQTWPASHVVQALHADAPLPLWYTPAPHGSHDVPLAPTLDWYVPALHWRQTLCPSRDWYVPAAHSKQ